MAGLFGFWLIQYWAQPMILCIRQGVPIPSESTLWMATCILLHSDDGLRYCIQKLELPHCYFLQHLPQPSETSSTSNSMSVMPHTLLTSAGSMTTKPLDLSIDGSMILDTHSLLGASISSSHGVPNSSGDSTDNSIAHVSTLLKNCITCHLQNCFLTCTNAKQSC